MAGIAQVNRVQMRQHHAGMQKAKSRAIQTRSVYTVKAESAFGRQKTKRPVPVHIHLNNVSFVASAAQAPAAPSEADKCRAQINKLRPKYPWLYWPTITLFRIAIFLLERIGFGFRLN